MESSRNSTAKQIAFIGQLTALAVILQTSSLYLPLLGGFLSHFATLVIAMATTVKPKYGAAATFCTGFLLLFFTPKQIPALLLFDGPLGLWTGWAYCNYPKRHYAWLMASVTLVLGIWVLTWILGIPVLNGLTQGTSTLTAALLTTGFALVYCRAWLSFTDQVFQGLNRRLPLLFKEE